jgi:hypothetical protein
MKWAIAVLIFLSFPKAHAHAHISVDGPITPRSADVGLKVGPCGNIPRTDRPTILKAGATVTIEWQETINHPSRYEFYFSPSGDQNWSLLKVVPDTQDGTADLPHNYSTQITLPNQPCTDCTLQLIQVMLENPAAPTNYYSCADIQLTQQGVTQPPPGNSSTNQNCH